MKRASCAFVHVSAPSYTGAGAAARRVFARGLPDLVPACRVVPMVRCCRSLSFYFPTPKCTRETHPLTIYGMCAHTTGPWGFSSRSASSLPCASSPARSTRRRRCFGSRGGREEAALRERWEGRRVSRTRRARRTSEAKQETKMCVASYSSAEIGVVCTIDQQGQKKAVELGLRRSGNKRRDHMNSGVPDFRIEFEFTHPR